MLLFYKTRGQQWRTHYSCLIHGWPAALGVVCLGVPPGLQYREVTLQPVPPPPRRPAKRRRWAPLLLLLLLLLLLPPHPPQSLLPP